MFEFAFDVPLLISGPAIAVILCLFGLLGMLFVRRRVLSRMRVSVEDSEFSGAILQSVMVFYGLALALLMVNVSQTYGDTGKLLGEESGALNMLYRDVTSYPEPLRSDLQGQLSEYTQYVIREAWPLQRRGQVPGRGIDLMSRFQPHLAAFEPASEGQKLLHAETLRAYNLLIHARRARLDAVNTGLPSVMWAVIVAGAFISIGASFFFQVEDARLHGILVVLLSLFVSLVIFMILALDRPFRGDLGLDSGPYQLVYDQLMKEKG